MHERNKTDLMYLLWIVALAAIFAMALFGPGEAHGAQLFVHQFNFRDNADKEYISYESGIESFRPIPQYWPFMYLGNDSLNSLGTIIYHYEPGFSIECATIMYNIYSGGSSSTTVSVSTDDVHWNTISFVCGATMRMSEPMNITGYVSAASDLYVKIEMYTPPSLLKHPDAEFAQSGVWSDVPGYQVILSSNVPEPDTLVMAATITVIVFMYSVMGRIKS